MIRSYKGILPRIHPDVYIEDSAQLIGDVHIGQDSSVWFNAVIRGDVHYIRIGSRTNIQDGCVLHVTKNTHPLILKDEITVGHNVTLHGCLINDRCLIGMGAVILDDAEIGEESIVGAGALVTEGMKTPPGKLLLGAPARIARDLRKEEIDRIEQSSQNYIDYVASYRENDVKKCLSAKTK